MTAKRQLTAADLYRLRLISDPQIAPDGSRVAFVLKQMNEDKDEYLSNIYVVDREGAVVQFTAGDKDSAPRWSPSGKHLAFLSGRKEGAQIHLIATTGGESVALTERKLGAGVPDWSPDGTAIAFTAAVSTDPEEEKETSEEKGKKKKAPTKIIERASYKLDGAGYIGHRRRHLFVIDVAARTVEQLTDGDFQDDGASWSPDGQHIAFSSSRDPRWDVSLEHDIYVIPRSGGTARRLSPMGAFADPIFSPDGSRLAFVGNTDLDNVFAPSRLYSVNRDGSDFRDEQGDWDGTLGNWVIGDTVQPDFALSKVWRPDGIYFQATQRGECNLYRATGGAVSLVTHGAHDITDWSIAADGTLAYARGDSTHLAEVYLQSDEEVVHLTHENDAFLGEVAVNCPERLTYVGANGEEGDGWLLAPRGSESGKHPLIVYIHGGPTFAYGEAFFFEFQLLAGLGFGVFFPNIHGSTSYGAAYQNSIRNDWGNLDYQDVLAGTQSALTREWVDPARVGIIGGSYGGYMTIWAMGHTDLYRAGVTERCLSNFISFFGTSDGGWIWNRVVGVYPEDDVQALWNMSPIKYIANVHGPLMVMHSEGDDRTPLEQGEQVFLALRRLHKETKFVVFPEESHGLSRAGTPSRRVERFGHISGWFRDHL